MVGHDGTAKKHCNNRTAVRIRMVVLAYGGDGSHHQGMAWRILSLILFLKYTEESLNRTVKNLKDRFLCFLLWQTLDFLVLLDLSESF